MEKDKDVQVDEELAIEPHVHSEQLSNHPYGESEESPNLHSVATVDSRIGLFLVLGLAVFSAAGNFGGTAFFIEEMSSSTPGAEFILSSAIGLLVAQACLLGTWFALGAQKFFVRSIGSVGLLLAIYCFFVMGVRYFDDRMPAEAILVMLAIAILLPGIIAIPMWIIRLKSRIAITREVASAGIQASQFSIGHLLAAMVVVSILIPICQATFSQFGFENSNAPWIEICSFIAIYMVLTCLVCWLAVAVVFDPGRRVVSALMLITAIGLGSAVAAATMAFSFSSFSGDLFANTLNSIGYAAFLAFAIVTALAIFNIAGYRLR